MSSSQFHAGLTKFSDQYAQVQHQLIMIEQNGISFRNQTRYRGLLDELIEIALARASYCSRWRESAQPS